MEKPKPLEMRKIVPVAAMISAGKSKLLNVLYNIDFLECKAGIGTKFINILRYNPEIKEPRFFHLLLKKEGEKYIFYKDSLYQEIVGNEKIIEENKNINKILAKQKDTVYENIFYMTEVNESPFIKDINYLMTHDLCDIPGLSEYQEGTIKLANQNKEEINKVKIPAGDVEKLEAIKSKLIEVKNPGNKIKKEKKTIDEELKEINDLEGKDLQIQDKKEEDDLYYNIEIEKNSYIYEIFNIIKDYIDGAIIILNVEKFYFKQNFEMIAILHKIIKKKIKNFLIILNKMDLSQNPKEDIAKCKAFFLKYFPSCKTFNINLNTFVPLSTIQLENELLLNKSFKHLLNYHFYNYIYKMKKEENSGAPIKRSFIDHLRDIIRTIKGITKEEIEKKVNESIIINDEEIIKIINDIKNEFKGKEINYGITEEDFKNVLDKEENLLELDIGDLAQDNKNTNINEVNPSYIVKMIYILQKENKLIPPLSDESHQLLNYFHIPDKKNDQTKNSNKTVSFSNNIQTMLNKQIMINLIKVTKKIEKSKFIGTEIKNIVKELYLTIDYLKIYDVIFIPFLGPSNAGKSTIINNIIGEDVLPTDLNECTKRGILVRYSEDNDNDITIRKAVFKQKEFLGKKNYYFESEEIIATGLKNVKDTIKGLNYEFPDKEENSFYYIRTKIKLFDDLGFDDYLKKIIYLIDFPGFGTDNIFENGLYQKVVSICNSFIFVVRNSIIKEKMNKILLDNLFTQTMKKRHKLPSGFVKSCLFILNNDNSQEITEHDLLNAKRDIKSIIPRIEKEDINVCFFNAKFYKNYLSNFNYFFNMTKAINDEYENYNYNYRYSLFLYPELYNHKPYLSFGDYVYKSITDRFKNEGLGTKIKQVKNVSEGLVLELDEVIRELIYSGSIEMNEFSPKIKAVIPMLFAQARENLINLQTLKESNIDKFKTIFLNQINNINNEMQTELKEKIDKVIKTLDYFFNTNFSERQKDLQSFEHFKTNIKNIIEKMENLLANSKLRIKSIIKNYGTNVKESLEKKKENLGEALNSKNYRQIEKEIDEQMKSKTNELNEEIQSFFNNIDYNSNMLYQQAQEYFLNFTENKMRLDDFSNFKIYFRDNVSKKDANISDEIYKEINSCIKEGMSKIWEKKSLIDFISSCFSPASYLSNILDIIIEFYCGQIYYIINLLKKSFGEYIKSVTALINSRLDIISAKYTQIQKKEWENLCELYKATKDEINKSLKIICNK